MIAGEFSGKCPNCGEYVDIDKFCEVGGTVFCPSCDAELQIKSLEPVKLVSVGKVYSEEDEHYVEDYGDDEDMDWDE